MGATGFSWGSTGIFAGPWVYWESAGGLLGSLGALGKPSSPQRGLPRGPGAFRGLPRAPNDPRRPPADPQQTPNRLPTGSQQTPNRPPTDLLVWPMSASVGKCRQVSASPNLLKTPMFYTIFGFSGPSQCRQVSASVGSLLACWEPCLGPVGSLWEPCGGPVGALWGPCGSRNAFTGESWGAHGGTALKTPWNQQKSAEATDR